jgi:hypothetical protein
MTHLWAHFPKAGFCGSRHDFELAEKGRGLRVAVKADRSAAQNFDLC